MTCGRLLGTTTSLRDETSQTELVSLFHVDGFGFTKTPVERMERTGKTSPMSETPHTASEVVFCGERVVTSSKKLLNSTVKKDRQEGMCLSATRRCSLLMQTTRALANPKHKHKRVGHVVDNRSGHEHLPNACLFEHTTQKRQTKGGLKKLQENHKHRWSVSWGFERTSTEIREANRRVLSGNLDIVL